MELNVQVPSGPVGDALVASSAFISQYWFYLGLGVVAIFLLKPLLKRKPEEVVRKRQLYVSKGGNTQAVEIDPSTPGFHNEDTEIGDDTMAKKQLDEVWRCSECEEAYDTKKEAEEDGCDDATYTKEYCCSECEECYATKSKAQNEDECSGKFKIELDSYHMIDGKVVYGRMKCGGCEWEGAIEDTDKFEMYETTTQVVDGKTLQTSKPGLVFHLCPECSSEQLAFVPKVKV